MIDCYILYQQVQTGDLKSPKEPRRRAPGKQSRRHMNEMSICTAHVRTWYLVVLALYITMYKCVFFVRPFFSSGPGSFLVLSAPGHAGSSPEHHGASVRPGRCPWHVLWGVKVTSNHGEAFRARRAIQAHANPRSG